MTLNKVAFLLLLVIQNSLSNFPHLFGSSLNSKAVANGLGQSNGSNITGSETTSFGLDDVSQSKTYAHGNQQSNARTDAQSLWTNVLHGAKTGGDSIQDGKGDTLADSWSKSFTPTSAYYKTNYKDYVKFLNELHARKGKLDPNDPNSHEYSVANYKNPDFKYNGEVSFDLQQGRGSGDKTSSRTESQTFNWGPQDTISKGESVANAKKGWATSNNSNWALGKYNYVTVNKNSAAFGNDALTKALSNFYLNKGLIYNTGKAWGQSLGDKAFTYSNLNGNNFGYSALNGGSNSFSSPERSVALSEVRGSPFVPKLQLQPPQQPQGIQAN